MMPFRGGEGGSLSDRSEYEFLGLEQGDSDSDDDLEAFVRNARPTSGTSKFPAWPVVLSVVSVLTVLVFLVTAADYFQTDAQPYNPQCLQSFKVCATMCAILFSTCFSTKHSKSRLRNSLVPSLYGSVNVPFFL